MAHTDQMKKRKPNSLSSQIEANHHTHPVLVPAGVPCSHAEWPPAPASQVSVGKNDSNVKYSTESSHHKQKAL